MKPERANGKPRLLWCSDSPTVHTGFARVASSVLRHLTDRFHVGVLGLHHNGWPHGYPYPIYPAAMPTEPAGTIHLSAVVKDFQPDAILVLNDPYYVSKYIETAGDKKFDVPMLAYMPVDSQNMDPEVAEKLSLLETAIFYTQFGLNEATEAGFHGRAAVIPHGIDLDVFRPLPQGEARARLGKGIDPEAFIVGNVNRNQPRKRLDLTVAYFAEWVRREKLPKNVKLYLHCALDDCGWRVDKLAHYFGVGDRMILTAPDLTWDRGIDEDRLRDVYNSLDVQVSTTLGEGWGLTMMEGMACGIPQIVPDWSALGEWARGAAELVPCCGIDVFPGLSNGIGGVVDGEAFVSALSAFYRDHERRAALGSAGLARVSEPRFRWETIAGLFGDLIEQAIAGGAAVEPVEPVGEAHVVNA